MAFEIAGQLRTSLIENSTHAGIMRPLKLKTHTFDYLSIPYINIAD